MSENFDFAIRYGRPAGNPFEETLLFGDSVQPVCTPAFASHHDLHTDRSNLSGVPLIHVLNRTGDPAWTGFDAWGKAFAVEPSSLETGIRFSKAGSGLQSAIAGEGLVMAGMVEAYHALADGRLTMPFGSNRRCETTYKYRLLRHRDAPMTAMQRTFSTWLIERAKRFNRQVEDLLDRF